MIIAYKSPMLNTGTPSKDSQLAQTALAAAASYRGTQRDYKALMKPLLQIEETLQAHAPDGRTSDTLERQFFEAATGTPYTLNGLLEKAAQARNDALSRMFDTSVHHHGIDGLVTISRPQILIPPEKPGPKTGSGNGGFEDTRFEPRLQKLLSFLSDQEIGLDQLVIYEGIVDPASMRKHSYYVVDILPRGVQVGVCNQVGNATFVAQKPLSILEWAAYGKEELQEKFGVKRVEHHNDAQWCAAIWDHIVTSNAPRLDDEGVRAAQAKARQESPPLTKDIIWRDVLDELAVSDPKKWVGAASGPVMNCPGDTWKARQHMLSLGGRGLEGGSSIHQFIAERVHATGETYKEQHGAYPDRNSGVFTEDPRLTWADIDDAYQKGTNAKSSLHRVFHGDTLTKESIWRDVLDELAASDIKKWVSQASGPVMNCPGDTWSAREAMLIRGGRGLEGGSSISQLITERIRTAGEKYKEQHGEYPHRNVGAFADDPRLTWADIDDAHQNRHGIAKSSLHRVFHGDTLTKDVIWRDVLDELAVSDPKEWVRRTGNVMNCPGDTWNARDTILFKGGRGLEGDSSITQLIAERVRAAGERYKEEHGTYPDRDSGTFAEDPRLTWVDLDDAFLNNKGAKSSLHRVFHGDALTKNMIWRDVLDELAASDIKKWASQKSGPVMNCPGDTWSTRCQMLIKGGRGLEAGSSLSQEISQNMERVCRDFEKEHRAWPWRVPSPPPFDAMRGISWDDTLQACLVNTNAPTISKYIALFKSLDPDFTDPYQGQRGRAQPQAQTPSPAPGL